ncbi:hypothetical protein B0H13DRAFT_1867824 [Mycena leptocephala]|nr:hypothetical protein B0H13DRAFT_1867824 [Mycena leptocephala]
MQLKAIEHSLVWKAVLQDLCDSRARLSFSFARNPNAPAREPAVCQAPQPHPFYADVNLCLVACAARNLLPALQSQITSIARTAIVATACIAYVRIARAHATRSVKQLEYELRLCERDILTRPPLAPLVELRPETSSTAPMKRAQGSLRRCSRGPPVTVGRFGSYNGIGIGIYHFPLATYTPSAPSFILFFPLGAAAPLPTHAALGSSLRSLSDATNVLCSRWHWGIFLKLPHSLFAHASPFPAFGLAPVHIPTSRRWVYVLGPYFCAPSPPASRPCQERWVCFAYGMPAHPETRSSAYVQCPLSCVSVSRFPIHSDDVDGLDSVQPVPSDRTGAASQRTPFSNASWVLDFIWG